MKEAIEEIKNAISYAEKQEHKAIPVTLEWLEALHDALKNSLNEVDRMQRQCDVFANNGDILTITSSCGCKLDYKDWRL